jgi:hypothetical protein
MNWRLIGFTVGLAGVLFGLIWRWAIMLIQKLSVARQDVGVVESPPNNLAPADIGMLLNSKLTKRELVATLLDLQARQIIRLEVAASKLTIYLLQPSDHRKTKGFESLLVSKLFTGSLKQRDLSSIDKEFFKQLIVDLQNAIRAELVEEKVYDQPPRIKRTGPILLGFVIICVIVAVVYGLNYLLPGSASIVLAVAGLAAGWWLVNSSRLSSEGIQDLAQVVAFKKYLSSSKQKVSHELYHKYLAYAYVLGVEKQWAAKCGSKINHQLMAKLNKL